jgi:hypothetical protein
MSEEITKSESPSPGGQSNGSCREEGNTKIVERVAIAGQIQFTKATPRCPNQNCIEICPV